MVEFSSFKLHLSLFLLLETHSYQGRLVLEEVEDSYMLIYSLLTLLPCFRFIIQVYQLALLVGMVDLPRSQEVLHFKRRLIFRTQIFQDLAVLALVELSTQSLMP